MAFTENSDSNVSRRSFIRNMVAAGIAPTFLRAPLFGQQAPNNLLRIGCIGVGRMGRQNMSGLMSAGAKVGAQIVNDPEASALMHYSYREGFRLPG